MRAVRNTRKFNGKTYKLHDWYTSEFIANTVAKHLRQSGYSVRVILRPKSKTRGGYPLMDLWYVWKRKS